MFRRSIALLLALCLLAMGVPALAAPGDAIIGQNVQEDYNDYINGSFVLGDTLYLRGDENLYSFRVGDADLVAHPIEKPQAEENRSMDVSNYFVDGDQVYALLPLFDTSGQSYSLLEVRLYPVDLSGDTVRFGEPVTLNWPEEMTSDYGDGGVYMCQLNAVLCLSGTLYMLYYNDSGEAQLYALNIESQEGEVLDIVNPLQMTAYTDDQILVESYDYNQNVAAFYGMNIDGATPIKEVTLDQYEYGINGIAYSQDSSRLFYAKSGYLMVVENFDFDNAQQVAELSNGYSVNAGVLLPGDYYVCTSYDATIVRSTSGEGLANTVLTVLNNSYSDAVTQTYYDFTNTHGDITVVLSTDYVADDALIAAMLNNDSSTDIYVASINSMSYETLYDRGYLYDLSGSEKISAAVNAMYPGIRGSIEKDGEILAVPLEIYGYTVGIDSQALEKMGYAQADVPTNWPDFLDFIGGLADDLGEDSGVSLFDSYVTVSGARRMLMDTILNSYQNYISANGMELSYNTPELKTVLEKLEAIDFVALGLPEEDPDEEQEAVTEVTYDMNSSHSILLETGIGCTIGNFYSDKTPILLRFTPDAEPQLPLDITVAFINPYSEHPQQALEFVEGMMDNLRLATSYNLSDAQNEPVRSSYYEESKKGVEDSIAETKKQLETAEPADKQMLEEQLAEMETYYKSMDETYWEVGPRDIEWYRANAQYITPVRYNYFYNDEEGELSTLLQQYMDGAIPLDAFLQGVDKKVRMMALEGN